jgi:hypothetical protein
VHRCQPRNDLLALAGDLIAGDLIAGDLTGERICRLESFRHSD